MDLNELAKKARTNYKIINTFIPEQIGNDSSGMLEYAEKEQKQDISYLQSKLGNTFTELDATFETKRFKCPKCKSGRAFSKHFYLSKDHTKKIAVINCICGTKSFHEMELIAESPYSEVLTLEFYKKKDSTAI